MRFLRFVRALYIKSGLALLRYNFAMRLKNIKETEEIHSLRKQSGVSISESVVFGGMPRIHICENSVLIIGEHCQLISSNSSSALGLNHPVFISTIRPGAQIIIGDDTGISGGTFVAAIGITIGKEVLIGANVTIIDNDFHPLKANGRRYDQNPDDICSKPVLIEDGVFLGTGAMILKGVHIGQNAVVGAGAVVVKDVPAGSIVAGNPARPIGTIPE